MQMHIQCTLCADILLAKKIAKDFTMCACICGNENICEKLSI